MVFIYFLGFAAVVGATFAYMWKLMSSTLNEFNNPSISRKNVHPEMKNVQTGEELLVFNASKDEDDEEDDDLFVVRR